MMEYISRIDLLKQIGTDSKGIEGSYGDTWKFLDTIKEMPSIEIVFCKDCRHREDVDGALRKRLPEELIGKCWKTQICVREDDFCAGGEKGEEE